MDICAAFQYRALQFELKTVDIDRKWTFGGSGGWDNSGRKGILIPGIALLRL
jgi:hypothetical protein